MSVGAARLGLELRHALRRLAHDWRFTTATVLLLAFGIGVNAAIFSVVNTALFRRSAATAPDRLVDIYQRNSNPGGVDGNSYPAYRDMAEFTDVFASTMATSVPSGVSVRDRGAVRTAVVEYTTPAYLEVLGLRTALGRWFDASETAPNAPVVAVVAHRSWTTRFGADPAVVGRTLQINGVPVTIIGVGPVGHNATIDLGIVTDFWLPVAAVTALGAPPGILARRPEEAGFLVKARLRDGVTLAQARTAMDNLAARLAAQYPDEDPGAGISMLPARDVRVHPQLDPVLRSLASVMLGLVGFVLAIVCSNLATLLLVRGAARAREISIRLALGCARWQLVRQLLLESVILSLAGGAAGALLAWWTIRWVASLDLPVALDLGLDYRVLAFATVLSLVTGLAFGLAPALQATRLDIVSALRDAGAGWAPGRRLTLRNVLVLFQVAVSVALLGGTAVFLQLVSASRAQRAGFAVDGVAMVEADTRFSAQAAGSTMRVFDDLRRRVAAMPGVESVVVTSGLPMQTSGAQLVVDSTPDATVPTGTAGAIWSGPGYFDVLRIPILFGRALDDRDRPDTPRVAVVSESFARQLFGQVNAVGRRFRPAREPDGWVEIVGIVPDTGTADRNGDLVDPTPRLYYRSYLQWDRPPTAVLARTSLDATALAGTLQQELRALDSTMPVVSAKTMTQYLEESLQLPQAVALGIGSLGLLGIGLAAIGLYAVLAFAVSQRAREIGIRVALGARAAQVVWSVSRGVTLLIAGGSAAGLGLSVLLILGMRAAATPAPGISLYRPSVDPLALVTIAAVMAVAGLAAAFFPARRAARMDPLAAIRRE